MLQAFNQGRREYTDSGRGRQLRTAESVAKELGVDVNDLRRHSDGDGWADTRDLRIDANGVETAVSRSGSISELDAKQNDLDEFRLSCAR